MHQDRMRTPQEQDDVSERAIMDALIDHPGPWALAELQREFKDPLSVEDAVNRLAGVGMIHRLGDDFVFASRTATRAAEVFDG
jgi:hypothetical protein